ELNSWNVTSGLMALFLVLAIVPSSPTAVAQGNKPAARIRTDTNAKGPSPLLRELDAREEELESAKRSGEQAGIIRASRQLAGLAMRQLGEINLNQTATHESITFFRRSLDFGDAPETHLDLASAYLLADKRDEALAEVANLLVTNSQNARAWRVQGQAWLLKK